MKDYFKITYLDAFHNAQGVSQVLHRTAVREGTDRDARKIAEQGFFLRDGAHWNFIAPAAILRLNCCDARGYDA